MEYRLVSAIEFLRIPEKEVIDFGEGKLLVSTPNDETNLRYGTQEFFYRAGEIERDKILRSTLLHLEGQYESTLARTKTEDQANLMNFLMSWFELTINGLWFVKDNSCFPGTGFFVLDKTYNVASIKRPAFVSNALGQFDNYFFTMEEIEESVNINVKLANFFTVPQDFEDPSLQMERNRIERAFDILKVARNSQLLHQKIAFYVAAIECLFSTSFYKNTKKVPKHAAKYLGGVNEIIDENESTLKSAYEVRSNYFHGGVQKIASDEVGNLSKKVDQILRKIFVKVITQDSSKFLQTTEEVELWLNNL